METQLAFSLVTIINKTGPRLSWGRCPFFFVFPDVSMGGQSVQPKAYM